MPHATNAAILAQLALLGSPENTFENFLADPERGLKLMQSLVAFDASCTGFKNDDLFGAASGLARLAEGLLDHLIARHKGNSRIKNFAASGNLLLVLRAGAIMDRKALNRLVGTFYLDWPFAAHFNRDIYRIPAANLTVFGLVYGGIQKLRDLLDEQTGLA